jgi:ribosomal protein L2
MKLSKKAKCEQFDAIAKERDLWQQLANALINGREPDAVEEVIEDAGECYNRYEFRLYDALRANGGIVATISHIPGQSAYVAVALFEDWVKSLDNVPHGIGLNTQIKIAGERLASRRRAMYYQESHQH